jgi:tetratricopeptide (TPR) repeat protein
MLGEAYTQAGRFTDAHRVFDEAFATAEKNDDRFQEAELHRLAGELLLAESRDRAGAAEARFRRAIDLARRQASRAWELRATTSLARPQQQGRAKRPAVCWQRWTDATEGFATPDLVRPGCSWRASLPSAHSRLARRVNDIAAWRHLCCSRETSSVTQAGADGDPDTEEILRTVLPDG